MHFALSSLSKCICSATPLLYACHYGFAPPLHIPHSSFSYEYNEKDIKHAVDAFLTSGSAVLDLTWIVEKILDSALCAKYLLCYACGDEDLATIKTTPREFPTSPSPPKYRSPPTSVRPVEALRCVTVWGAVLAAHTVAVLLRSVNLCLKGSRVGVDPLELLQVTIEDTNNVAQLYCVLVRKSKQVRAKE